ncbi:hypothetical protein EK904_010847 [Melospiza melodia maxima]|nr:hypothetical protein EK904_010847 [Melospiza melodia maxima]
MEELQKKVARGFTVKANLLVQIQFNCIEVNVAQHIYVTMKTVPHYCEVKLSQQYYVEAGKLAYNLDRARKMVTVNVSNFPRDQDYYVRLCHKWFTCEDAGAFAVVLWDNIVYNPSTQTLAWEPACPVLVMVNLCRFTKLNDHCEDIEKSFKNSSEKVKYSRVDTHPRLCMKFTTKRGSWIKCPFAHGEFPAWKMRTAAVAEQIQVFFTSQTKAQFSVLVCNRTQMASCESLGMHHSVSVGDPVSITMSQEMCGSTICIQFSLESETCYEIKVVVK